MRILYLHQHFSTPEGAGGTRSFALAAALAARGHAVTIACGQYAGATTGLDGPFRHGLRQGPVGACRVVEFAIPCGNAQRLPARAAAFLRYAGRATRLALAEPWDLIIASSTPLTVALPALAARRLRGIPFLFEIRDPWPELPRAMRAGPPWLWRGMDRLADAAFKTIGLATPVVKGQQRRHVVASYGPAKGLTGQTRQNGLRTGPFIAGSGRFAAEDFLAGGRVAEASDLDRTFDLEHMDGRHAVLPALQRIPARAVRPVRDGS